MKHYFIIALIAAASFAAGSARWTTFAGCLDQPPGAAYIGEPAWHAQPSITCTTSGQITFCH